MSELEKVIYKIYQKYGGLYVGLIRQNLAFPRPFSYGLNGDAYSKGRKKQYSGSAPKSKPGDPLYDSIQYLITKTSNTFNLEILANDYAKYVDKGRRPGKGIPVAVARQIAQSTYGTEAASYAINKNIKKFGIQPTNFLTSAEITFKNQYEQRMENEIQDVIGDFLGNFINENIE